MEILSSEYCSSWLLAILACSTTRIVVSRMHTFSVHGEITYSKLWLMDGLIETCTIRDSRVLFPSRDRTNASLSLSPYVCMDWICGVCTYENT